MKHGKMSDKSMGHSNEPRLNSRQHTKMSEMSSGHKLIGTPMNQRDEGIPTVNLMNDFANGLPQPIEPPRSRV